MSASEVFRPPDRSVEIASACRDVERDVGRLTLGDAPLAPPGPAVVRGDGPAGSPDIQVSCWSGGAIPSCALIPRNVLSGIQQVGIHVTWADLAGVGRCGNQPPIRTTSTGTVEREVPRDSVLHPIVIEHGQRGNCGSRRASTIEPRARPRSSQTRDARSLDIRVAQDIRFIAHIRSGRPHPQFRRAAAGIGAYWVRRCASGRVIWAVSGNVSRAHSDGFLSVAG